MVSKSTLRAYEFETIEDYFQYIVLSQVNGQFSQVDSLIKAMSKEQKKDCLEAIDSDFIDEDIKYKIKRKLLKLI